MFCCDVTFAMRHILCMLVVMSLLNYILMLQMCNARATRPVPLMEKETAVPDYV